MEQDDQKLVEKTLSGDREAFEHIVNRHLKGVYNFVYRTTGGQEESSDITQEVFVKIWKNLKHYKPTYNFKTWAFTIAHNTTIDWFRKRKNIPFSTLDTEGSFFEDTISGDDILPDELFAREESKKILSQVLSHLSPEPRAIIILHDVEDMTFEEIAVVLGKPMNTVKSTYRRSLSALKAKLKNAPNNG
jgi:RNA polymerase sigma-70 factor (ECF subfamily)